MYSIDKKEKKNIEIDIHPISKWKRILVYLADMAISFIIAVILVSNIILYFQAVFSVRSYIVTCRICARYRKHPARKEHYHDQNGR